jgi:hypothetical protein
MRIRALERATAFTKGFAALLSLTLLPAAFALPRPPKPLQQDQQPDQQATPSSADQPPATLGEAARRAREQKKEQAKAARIWDDENIPKTPNTVNVVGQSPSAADQNAGTAPAATDAANPLAAGDSASAPAQPAPGGTAKSGDNKAEIDSQLSAAKDLLQSLQKDLDLLQRQLTLDQQSFYGKTNFANDKQGAAAIKAESDQAEAKRQEVAAAQARVDALQAKAGPPLVDTSKPN